MVGNSLLQLRMIVLQKPGLLLKGLMPAILIERCWAGFTDQMKSFACCCLIRSHPLKDLCDWPVNNKKNEAIKMGKYRGWKAKMFLAYVMCSYHGFETKHGTCIATGNLMCLKVWPSNLKSDDLSMYPQIPKQNGRIIWKLLENNTGVKRRLR